jgi:excisionase family DNA binding protein
MTEISTDLDAARERLRDQAPAPYLTVGEAAQLARCNPKTIRRAFTAGTLRAFRPAHRVLLREDDVRAWIEGQAAAEPEPPRAGRSRSRRPAPGSVASLRDMERQAGR